MEVGDESDNLRSKDLTALSVRILLDGLSEDMDECDGRESIVIVRGYQSRCLSAQALKQCGCDNFTMCAYQIIRHPGLFLSVLPPRALVDIINNTLEKSWRQKIYLHQTTKYSEIKRPGFKLNRKKESFQFVASKYFIHSLTTLLVRREDR